MRRDKGLIKIDGNLTIVDTMICSLKALFDEILIVTNRPSLYERFEATVVEDLIKNKGALGGILSGLCFSTSHLNFVVGCDMPFINSELVNYMLHKPQNYDVVIPAIDGKMETLFARYSKRALPTIFSHLLNGELRIQDILEKLLVLKINSQEIERFDAEHRSFFNLNTPGDLRKARKLLI